jgi:F0F1-type ATP synthase epsilon subunit
MGMSCFSFCLLSAHQLIYKAEVYAVTLPSAKGQVTLLNDHMSMVSALEAGKVCVQEQKSGALKDFEICGGFFEMTSSECIVYAHMA